jgi:hypothetical protein
MRFEGQADVENSHPRGRDACSSRDSLYKRLFETFKLGHPGAATSGSVCLAKGRVVFKVHTLKEIATLEQHREACTAAAATGA